MDKVILEFTMFMDDEVFHAMEGHAGDIPEKYTCVRLEEGGDVYRVENVRRELHERPLRVVVSVSY